MPKGYFVGHITVTDPEGYKEYVAKDTPILEGFGGKFIVRGGDSETPEGETLQRHVVIEFPSYAKLLEAYNSPEYQAVADIRKRCAESVIVLVEGT